MRPLEIIIPCLLAIYLLWPLIGLRPIAVTALPALALVLILLHILIEGARWQMVPIYVLAAVLFLTGFPALIHAGPVNQAVTRGWPLAGLILLLLAVSTLVPALLPVPTLLAPTGPYVVGTRTFVLTDPGRKEIYSGKDEARKFMLEV